jgi:hypothetical protein
MFNRSEIMKAAWTIYRNMTRTARPNTVAGRRKWFANALRSVWAAAKQAAADAIKTASQRAAKRIAALKAEILVLDCKPFGIRIGTERKAFAIFASMAGVPIQVIEALDMDDFDKLSQEATPLMGKSAEKAVAKLAAAAVEQQ